MKSSAAKVLGEDHLVTANSRDMIGEDFSYFTREKPACFFKLGTGNKEKGITAALHQVNFDVDENALEVGVKIFTQFVYDHMNGF